MKIALIVSILVSGLSAAAATSNHAKSFNFQFKMPKNKAFVITQIANTKEQAFKLAASECFQKLTGGKYPGEEKGLEIIDICANPKM